MGCLKFALVFGFFGICLFAHVPGSYLKEQKHLVSIPVLNLHEECSEFSRFVSQAIYEHQVAVIEDRGGGWALVETEDGYQGYALISDLISDDPRWRTSDRLCRTQSIASLVYSTDDTKWPAVVRLPFSSRIELANPLNDDNERWLKIHLLDGTDGWIQRGDVEKFRAKKHA